MATFIDGYEIDVTTDESHAFDSMVTGDPVEEGADTTDNVKLLPNVVTMTGIVSDTPFGQLAERRRSTVIGEIPLHSSFALDFLLEVRELREPVTIETNLRKYESMVLERLTVPQNVRTGDSLQFTAVFKQIRIQRTERTTVNVAVPRNGKKVKQGATTPAPAAAADPTAATAAEAKAAGTNKSWANQLFR